MNLMHDGGKPGEKMHSFRRVYDCSWFENWAGDELRKDELYIEPWIISRKTMQMLKSIFYYTNIAVPIYCLLRQLTEAYALARLNDWPSLRDCLFIHSLP